MKQLIRFFIRTIPRPILIRFSGAFSLLVRLFYRGNKVECPICASGFRKFLPYGVDTRENVLCPKCLSLERHRAIWLYLRDFTNVFSQKEAFLHVAPEQCFYPRFRQMKHWNYLTADLESPMADMHFDIHHIPLESNRFDMVMCNHVLEHVEDDRVVMKELFRVLAPGGLAIMQVPLDYSLTETYENPDITDPLDREQHFKQKDHLRLYGLDYPDRLRQAGFVVEEIHLSDQIGPVQTEKYRLDPNEILYIAKKAEA